MTSPTTAESAALNDIRAVRAVIDAAGAMPMDQFDAMPAALAAAINNLYDHFEARVEELDRCEA
jgi:hypothetical protein